METLLFGFALGPPFPKLHVLHLGAAFPSQGFAGQSLGLFVTVFRLILLGSEAMGGQVLLGNDLEGLAALEAGHRGFLDGLFRVHGRGGSIGIIDRNLTGADSSNTLGDGLDHANDFVFRHGPGAGLRLHDFKGALNIVFHWVLTGLINSQGRKNCWLNMAWFSSLSRLKWSTVVCFIYIAYECRLVRNVLLILITGT